MALSNPNRLAKALRDSIEADRIAEQRAELERNAAAIRARCQSLFEFVQAAWHIIEPTTPFVGGWAIRVICDHLEAVTRGDITRLLITVPPGMSKSTIVAVFWPAWEWGPKGRPGLRYLSTSYSRKNVIRDNDKMKKLIASEWFVMLWGDQVKPTAKWGEELFINSALGQRDGRPFASMTGGRGDRVLIDDAHSTKTAESDTQREDTVRTFREGLTDRLNDPVSSVIVIIMQRLHSDDIAGVIIKLGLPYIHLNLPMEFESEYIEDGVRVDARCRTYVAGKLFFEDPRQVDGELLFPERFPREAVEALKKAKGSYAYQGQYQQRPVAREGGLFKRAWFAGKIVPRSQLPTRGVVWCRAWDFAASEATPGTSPDWSVGLLMLRHGADYYIANVDRFQDTAGAVQKTVVSRAETDPRGTVHRLPIDPAQAGKAQAQGYVTALAGHIVKMVRTSGRGNKAARAQPLAIQAEFGHVYFVNSGAVDAGVDPWIEPLIDELCSFPSGANDDQVDAAADAFDELTGARVGEFESLSAGRFAMIGATDIDSEGRFGDNAGDGGAGFGSVRSIGQGISF